eukprot:GHVP01064340.1.p1 GENE.GHVP01064340.1~~GHVP01064340.1.p1  ORF type:complete len:120 (-),score=8.97 GHVP01064340.1:533-892(-)
MDFVKAFHSVPIDKEDQKFYGFIGNDGKTYKYIVLPMGTRNSPALFSEFMAKSLQLLTEKYPENIRIYQDDVAISEQTSTIVILVSLPSLQFREDILGPIIDETIAWSNMGAFTNNSET